MEMLARGEESRAKEGKKQSIFSFFSHVAQSTQKKNRYLLHLFIEAQ
ncbi:MAG: hypothetical protein RLZZ224_1788 [Verrucomicrobiota bacterium]|jgi:hypothetical protein